MAKKINKTVWFCNQCGAESAKWIGKCPACGAWNSMVEEKVVQTTGRSSSLNTNGASKRNKPQILSKIESSEEERIKMPSKELNRVLGGGLVKGSLVLIGGEPGIGKSTLILQNILSLRSRRILYISGEESPSQIKMRADRLQRVNDNVYLACETTLENVFNNIEDVKPEILIVDSIQTISSEALDSSPGSVSQIRECAAQLLKYSKESNVPVLLIGHITKDGNIAGPKILEHIVDAVLQFEGDSNYIYRVLRSIKNRFGSTSEIGIFEMTQRGLREVTNPSEMLLHQWEDGTAGATIGVTIEGLRPFLIEIQALVSSAAYGTPQRSVTGFDSKRLNMLLAVLEKKAGFKLAAKDVFLNIAGGLKVNDPALDLPVICAVLSSNMDIQINPDVCITGEVGLSGEIRPVARLEQRISEAEKLGMKKILIPKNNLKGVDVSNLSISIVEVGRVEDAFRQLFV